MQSTDAVLPLDRAIVAALQLNGRATWNEVARHVGAEPRTVMRRAARLEESGLLRVIGVVDVLRCGLGIPVLVRYRCRPGTAPRVATALARRPQTRFVAVVAGSTDCVAEMVVPGHRELGAVTAEQVGSLPEVVETESLTVMHTFTSAHDWDPGVLDEAAVRQLRAGTGLQSFEDRFWEQAPEELDELDLRIVEILAESGRLSYKDVAGRADCGERTAARRVESMVERGCLRFRTLAEPEVLGYQLEFMLWLTVDPGELDRAGNELARRPSTKYLSAATGRFNLVGQVVLGHYGELYAYTTQVVGSLPGLRAADITLQTQTLKRAWTPTPEVPDADVSPGHGPLPPGTTGATAARREAPENENKNETDRTEDRHAG